MLILCFQSAFLKAKPYQKGFAKLALLLKISKWVGHMVASILHIIIVLVKIS